MTNGQPPSADGNQALEKTLSRISHTNNNKADYKAAFVTNTSYNVNYYFKYSGKKKKVNFTPVLIMIIR